MERLSSTEIIKKMQKMGISLFTLADFARLFGLNNQTTVYKKAQRLEKAGIVKRLTKGKYIFLFKKPNEYLTANFLYRPSYISLESALSFYGITTGFPYKIFSMTTKKPRTIIIEEQEYQYSQISRNLFWGFEKKEEFLIADKEKALIDFLYLSFKGLRHPNLDEVDLSIIDKKRLREYLGKIANQHFLNFVKKQKI
ncbi:hypothetical protein FJY90_01155 [Candidatus Gottesmanbacteria bacterium]|nr:hypothetical protein [Candidatus Gottesmanbacteria bacterium]